MPDIRKRTVYRRRLSSAAQTPKSLVCWRGSLCPILHCNRWLRKPLRPGSVEASMPAAVAATGSSGCFIPTAKMTSVKSRARFRAAAKVADYWVANLHGSYQLTKEWQIYGFINNLFNRKFATFGTFFDTQSTVANVIPNALSDPRMVTPAQPFSVYVGMRAKL